MRSHASATSTAKTGLRDSRMIATPTAAPSMKARLRYVSALIVNLALPWLAYRLAFPHYGQLGALVASALPLISGMIGLSFLVSLALPRPLVFYLGRSTRAREDHRSVESYEKHWRERPVLAAYIRLMTLVWGLGMTGENILRSLIIWQWPNDPRSALASEVLRYGVYAGLTVWTFWCRRRLKRDAMRYPPDPADSADATDRLAKS